MPKLTPFQQERKRRKRAKLAAQRDARRERKLFRMEQRRAKRLARAAPKRNLAAWSRAVRSAGRCDVCGATEHLQAHHVLPKERYPEFRFEPINGVCLCPTCHKWGRYSAHRNPLWFVLWLRRFKPEAYEWAKTNMGTPSHNGSGPNGSSASAPAPTPGKPRTGSLPPSVPSGVP